MGFAPPLATSRRVPPLVLSRLLSDAGDLMHVGLLSLPGVRLVTLNVLPPVINLSVI
jgi:hypothetical protein